MHTQSDQKKPQCIGMIMDGNRRYAKERGLSSIEGHTEGYEKLKEVIGWMKEATIPHLIVYAFSTENWNRSEEEVGFLLSLLRRVLSEEIEQFNDEGVRLICAGDMTRFPEDLQRLIVEAQERTKKNTEHTLVLGISYGGRAEILSAVNSLVQNSKTPIPEEVFSQALWTKDVPDPDIIIRTGGEKRLSGFLPWQSIYSELFFPKTYWPAFSKEEFLTILDEFSARERRRGK
ncbi:MAG: polyprenyl diphosphate synthase [Candidatus Paceibacterota bacterium]